MRSLLLSTLVASASAFSGTTPASSPSPPPYSDNNSAKPNPDYYGDVPGEEMYPAFIGIAPSSSPPPPPPCVPLPDSDLQLAHEKCWADFGSGRDACKLMPTKKERKKCMKENFDTFEIMTTR